MMYKVVETSMVTDEEIEKILNEWTARGYSFSSIHFVATEHPAGGMAFLFFHTGAPPPARHDAPGPPGTMKST